MPLLTNKSRLRPRTSPDVPPWCWLDNRTVQVWLGVSYQSLTNWRTRGTGPEWFEESSGRVWYQKATIEAWIEPPTAPVRITSYLQEHERIIGEALWNLPDPAHTLRALARVTTLNPASLQDLCHIVDQLDIFQRPPRRPRLPFVFQTPFIGYPAQGPHNATTI